MSTAPTAVTTDAAPNLEQKIELAAAQAEQVVAIFSPQAAALVQAGVAVEPIFSGLIHMIVGLFKHHTKTVTPAPVTQAPAAPAA